MLSSISHSLVPPARGAGRAPVLIFVAMSRDRHCCVWRYRTIENGIRREVYSSGRSSKTIKCNNGPPCFRTSPHLCEADTYHYSRAVHVARSIMNINSLKGLSCRSVRPSVSPTASLIPETNKRISIKY